MDTNRFEALVALAIETLPEEFTERMENIVIVVQDLPTPDQLTSLGLRYGETLFGLYEGVPLTRRSSHYGMVNPDKITVFQKPIEAKCRDDDEIAREIRSVVRHEIAHHFGIGDSRMRQLRRKRDKHGS